MKGETGWSSHSCRFLPLVVRCILCPKRDMSDAQAFIQCLMRIGPPMGMRMAPPIQYDLPDNRVGSYIRALQVGS